MPGRSCRPGTTLLTTRTLLEHGRHGPCAKACYELKLAPTPLWPLDRWRAKKHLQGRILLPEWH